MNTSFDALLKQKSAALSAKMTGHKKPDEPLQCTVTVADNVSPAELHVWFNRYPGPDTIADLKNAGFRWNSTIWWAIDSEPKRAFCRARLNAHELEPFTSVSIPENKPLPKVIVAPDRPKTEWETYTQQIDELLIFFRERKPDYTASDLQLAAIAAYHKAVFSQN